MSYEPQDYYADEKKGLLELSEETFFTFGKCDINTLQSDPSKLLPSVLLKNPRCYVSHSTRTFTIDSQAHYLTVFVLKLNLVHARIGSDECILSKAREHEGVDKPGLGSTFTERECKIICQVNGTLISGTHRGTFVEQLAFHPPIEGYFVEFGNQSMQIKDIKAEQPPKGYTPCSRQFQTLGLKLIVDFFHPLGILTDGDFEIETIYPDMKLSEACKVSLQVTQAKESECGSELEVLSLAIELHEIMKYLDCSDESGPRVLWDASYSQLQSRGIGYRYLLEPLRDKQPSSIEIPTSKYDCRVPPWGPSFFSTSFKRVYYLKFILRVRYTLSVVELVLVKPVQIAEFRQIRRHFSQSISPYHYMIFLEKLMGNPYVLPDVGKESLKRFTESGLVYLRHQTEAFVYQDALLAVTKVDYLIDNEETPKRNGLQEISTIDESKSSKYTNFVSQDKKFCITWKVTKDSSDNFMARYTGLVLKFNGTELPLAIPIPGLSINEDFSWLSSYPCFDNTYLYNQVSSRKLHLNVLRLERTMGGAIVLVPNRLLSDMLRLLITFNPDFLAWLLFTRLSGICIRSLILILEQKSTWLDLAKELCRKGRTRVLVRKFCKWNLGDMGYNINLYPTSPYIVDLPHEEFDVRIPHLKPTIFTNTYSRVYKLSVKLTLYHPPDDLSFEWDTKFPIQVAEEQQLPSALGMSK